MGPVKAAGVPFEVGDMIASTPPLLGGGYFGVIQGDSYETGSRVYSTMAVVIQVTEKAGHERRYVVLASLDEGPVIGNVHEAHKLGSGWQPIENFESSPWGRL